MLGSVRRKPSCVGLERAHRVDQPTTLAQHGGSGSQQPVLRHRQRPHVGRPFEVWHVGMTADRPGGAAGRVQQHGVEVPAGIPRRGIRLNKVRLQMPMPQVIP